MIQVKSKRSIESSRKGALTRKQMQKGYHNMALRLIQLEEIHPDENNKLYWTSTGEYVGEEKE